MGDATKVICGNAAPHPIDIMKSPINKQPPSISKFDLMFTTNLYFINEDFHKPTRNLCLNKIIFHLLFAMSMIKKAALRKVYYDFL
jgi:hypothetical protein